MARRIGSRTTGSDELLTREEAAEYLGVAAQTLAIWKVSGRYSLPVIKVGRLTRYRRSDLEKFLSQRTVDTSQSRNTKELAEVVGSTSASSFAEVKLVEPCANNLPLPVEDGVLEVILPNGIKLRLTENSLGLLSSVMGVLEKC